jgi:aryl-alcohol dehydrogenase-like predicted oxidoreductase
VSEIGLGTQRWVSKDFNAPDEALCKEMMNKAILEGGVNLIDTAEQYPIPSDFTRPEGLCEEVIGRWLKEGGPSRREKAVIATKITGGGRINKKSIISACEGSLQRLQTGEMPHPSADVLQLHAV